MPEFLDVGHGEDAGGGDDDAAEDDALCAQAVHHDADERRCEPAHFRAQREGERRRRDAPAELLEDLIEDGAEAVKKRRGHEQHHEGGAPHDDPALIHVWQDTSQHESHRTLDLTRRMTGWLAS